MLIRRKNLERMIRNAVDNDLSDRIKKLGSDTTIETLITNGRNMHYSSQSLSSIVYDHVSQIIDKKVNDVIRKINDDLNREDLIDSLVERINKKQIK